MKLSDYIQQKNIAKIGAKEETKGDKMYLNLSLSVNGKVTSWKFGTYKARQLIALKDDFKKSFEEFDSTKGTWTTTFVVPSGKFESKPMKINGNHVAALFLFEEEINDYITKNTVRGPKEAISEPRIIEVVDGFDTKNLLQIPCFPKSEGDTGEGLIPWTISDKKAKQIVNYAFDGDMETVATDWATAHPEEDLVWTGTKLSGETYEVKYTPDMVRAYLKYRKDIEKFERQNR